MTRKAHKLEKKNFKRLQGLHMGNVPEENKCNNLSFLSWIDAGDDFKT